MEKLEKFTFRAGPDVAARIREEIAFHGLSLPEYFRRCVHVAMPLLHAFPELAGADNRALTEMARSEAFAAMQEMAMRGEREEEEDTPPATRKCHDCGKPTTNYRCAQCRMRFLAKHGISLAVASETEG